MILLGVEFAFGCAIGALSLYLLHRYRAEVLDLVALVVLLGLALGIAVGLIVLAIMAPWPGIPILICAMFLGGRTWIRYQRAGLREGLEAGKWVSLAHPNRLQRAMRRVFGVSTSRPLG
jgi:hypothetical protein